MREAKIAMGITTPKDMIPEKPYKAIKPGFIMNVAALVMEAARLNPTAHAGKPLLPIAKSSIFFVFRFPLITKKRMIRA
tara:strand:+ start:40 stop:276 length:237 start_codon:yes stop_codon:yes gene_type:complete